MLDISGQMAGSFSQPVNQQSNLRPTRMRHQQPCNGKCGFFKFIELSPQLLAVFVKLLQRFIVVDKITIRGNPKLHMRITLMGQLLIFLLKYLAGILLPVEKVLHIDF
jgi:hypothetical protein